jgi:Mrp family chromosome partitioning ATPase
MRIKRFKKLKRARKAGGDGQGNLRARFLENYPSHSRFAESYRTLRTNLHFSFVNGDFRSILITSSGEQEGKTTTAANLAMTMARSGKSVLIIDADLRKPSLKRMLEAADSPGLTGLLSDTFGSEVVSGSLAEYGFSDLFWLLSFQKKTGKLRLRQDKEVVDIYFLEGEPMEVYWRTRPKNKKLANLLFKNRAITLDQAKRAEAWRRISREKFGATLVRIGAIKDDELKGYITLQTIEGLRLAMRLKEGRFVFRKLTPSQYDRPPVAQVDVSRLYRQMDIGELDLPYVEKNINNCIVNLQQDNLFLLPSGPRPPNPGEIIQSARMSFLLSYLSRKFDTIIIDTPPVLPASDALVLASQVDGVLMVVKSGLLNRKLVQKAVRQIYSTQANIIGVVLNQLDTKKMGYYKYYYKYYSKYYGERS